MYEASCSYDEGVADSVVDWTAPGTGCYTVNTWASDYDTNLAVLGGACSIEIDCVDDEYDSLLGHTTFTSAVSFGAEEGMVYTFVVSGYDSEGDWVLEINECE